VAKSSGRGIFYMRRFTDRVSFEFPKDGGVVVRLGKRLPGR
jgi:anti-sigma regulatory factor (Ser/Thr protein kinase)